MLVNPNDPKKNITADLNRGGKPPFGPTGTAQALQEPDDDGKKKPKLQKDKLLKKKNFKVE